MPRMDVVYETAERLRVAAPSPAGFRAPIRLSVPYDPWWVAVDEAGRPAAVRLAQSGFLAVLPPPGARVVSLSWVTPPSVAGLRLLGIATAILLVAMAAWAMIMRFAGK